MATAPQTAMDMPQEAGANPFADPNTMAVYDQMRQTMSPKEFGDEMLAGASQVDPEAMAQFRNELSQIDLSPEELDMLNNMVDEILANPEQYAAVRAKYLEMGAPEELLPEQFDPQFFAAMNMAVDQLIAEPSGVESFAKGGIAELKPIAKVIASYGRNGDTMLAHITPAEARMLRRRGGSGTINPATGLPEFFLKKAFKSLGKAIKSFASSTVGKIVTTVALGFFLGPAAAGLVGATSAAGVAAVSGFVGGAGSTLLGGGNLKDALKAGAIGGLTAGVTTGVTQGFGTAYQGPTTVGGQVDRFTGMFKTPAFPQYTAEGALTDNATSNAAREAYAGELYKTNPEAFYNPDAATPEAFSDPSNAQNQFTAKKLSVVAGPDGTVQAPPNTEIRPFYSADGKAMSMGTFPTDPPVGAPYDPATATRAVDYGYKPGGGVGSTPYKVPTIGESFSKMGEGLGMGDAPASFDTFKQGATDLFSPGPSSAEVTARARQIMSTTPGTSLKDAMTLASGDLGAPSFLRSYGPATVAGIGAIGAFGGFTPGKLPISPYQDMLTGGPGSARDLLNKNPNRYYVQGLPGVQYYNGSVIKPPGMATGGEVQYFAEGGVSDAVVAQWWKDNSNKGYSDAYIADLMDEFKVTPEQFARSIGANQETAADIASRYAAVPETKTITDSSGYDTQNIDLTRQSDGTYLGNNGQTYDASGTPIVAPPVVTPPVVTPPVVTPPVVTPPVTQVTGGGGNNTTVTGGGGNNAVVTPPVITRSATDQAIYDLFANNQTWTLGQFKTAIDAAKYSLADISRVTGTPLSVVQEKYALASTAPTTTLNPTVVTPPVVTTPPITTTKPPVTTTPGTTSLTSPWFINPQTFAQGTKGVTVPSSTLRNTTNLPTDALSRAIQGDLQVAGPTVSDATIQQFMDKQGYDPRQVAYATGAGLPEVQNRYYNAKNAGILSPKAPVVNTLKPYNTTARITELMSPTGPLEEVSTRAVTPVTSPAAAPVEKKLMNMGGIASLRSGGYPRRTGQINGPGTATSDSIPAMLSDGEFVMTAKAVRGAGKGDRRAGAKRMYALMHQLEKNAARG